MKQKFKRYLVIFPLVFTLLLSCVLLLGAHAADYSEYFLSPEDLPQFFDNYDKDYLFQKADEVDANTNGFMTADGYSSQDFDYYFYAVWCTKYAYDNYQTTPQQFECRIVFFNSDQLTPVHSDDDFITYICSYADSLYFTTDSSSSVFNPDRSKYYGVKRNMYFVYDKHAGQFAIYSNVAYSFNLNDVGYVFYEDCNIPDFPIPDGISHGSSLNVDVRFRPGLSGQVDRMLDNGDGTKSMVSQMRMTVVNNSRFPIQYKMYIMKKHRSTSRGGNLGAQHVNEKYDDDPVFIYYSNEWVYSNSLDNSSDWYNGHIQKQKNQLNGIMFLPEVLLLFCSIIVK